jgi:two-component system, chemotaxis family, chemotaxis protein CheY
MTTSMNGDTNSAKMVLPQILDLAAAEGFLESMRLRVKDGQPFCIDASAVEALTLPCIQIILAAQSCHGGISIENSSVAFNAAFEDLGVNGTWSLDHRQEQIQESIQEEQQDQAQDQDQDLDQERGSEQSLEHSQNHAAAAAQQPADDGSAQNEISRIDPQQTSESVMSKRILTIDDSKTMRDMLMLTLAEAGFDVLQAVDGQDGLDVLVNEQVDVVITDINMPRMDGYEVIRQLRSNPSHKTTPILVLTTESESEKKNLAREAGATGWMVKPFDPDRLVATVRKVAP